MPHHEWHVLDGLEAAEGVDIGAVQRQPQQRVGVAVAGSDAFDDAREVGPDRVDPVPAEVADRQAGQASPCRGGEGKRRDVAEDDVCADGLEQTRFGRGTGVERACKCTPARARGVDIELQSIVLYHAHVERPAWAGQPLHIIGEQPAWRVAAHHDPCATLQQRARHLRRAHRVTVAVA